MNTWIWGPPKWKFLHSLSFSPDAHAHSGAVATFLNTLSSVLPCKYCRKSYSKFVRELQAASHTSLAQTIATNQLPRWMYDLHDKVNAKLDKQVAADAAKQAGVKVSTAQHDALCRKRQITFECLTKRFILRPVSFCADDVWEFLVIFAYNMDLTRHQASADMQQQWHMFFNLLPQVAELAGASPSLVAALVAVRSTLGASSFLHAVVHAQAVYEKQPFTEDMVTHAQQLYSYARASACQHGSCA